MSETHASATIVWLDHKEAHFFFLEPKGIRKERHLNAARDQGHGHSESHVHAGDDKFMHEIAQKLGHATEILLMGPGLAKNHLKTHLESHHHTAIAQRIVGIENVDHPTDNQVVERARKFFKAYDAFH